MPTPNSIRRKNYQARKAAGLCPRCGGTRRKKSKHILCNNCRNFFKGYQEEIAFDTAAEKREKYNFLKKQHRCTRCGKKLSKNYKNTRCRECLDRQYSYANKKKK